MIKEIQSKLKPFFAEEKAVLFAYIFGSAAQGKTRFDSDVDLALYLDENLVDDLFQKRLTMIGKVQSLLQKTSEVLIIVRLVFTITLFAVILIGIRPIIERFSWVDLSREGRLTMFENTLDLIKKYPLFGTGLGTYVDSYEMFEKIDDKSLAMHAHDDYLEFAAESGLIGGGCLIVFAFGALCVIFVRWIRRRDYFVRGIGLGCMLGIAAMLIHSMSDFNLHIPANAVYFCTLYALAFRLVSLKRNDKSHYRE